MRVLALTLFTIVLLLGFAAMTATAQSKSICVPLQGNGTIIDPSQIPATQLTNMNNRGQGNYTFGISLCQAAAAPSNSGCSGVGFVSVSNSSGCLIGFDTALSRPTVAAGGFQVKYGSTMAGHTNDDFSLQVLCDPTGSAYLVTKSNKFATQTPNKNGGTSYVVVLYSKVACGKIPTPPTPAGSTCRSFVQAGQLINPMSWTSQFFDLINSPSAPEIGFLFSVCVDKPTPPSFEPCASTSYITMYPTDAQCAPWNFDIITNFTVQPGALTITYSSSKNNYVAAIAQITCLMGSTTVVTQTGFYSNSTINGVNTYVFPLGVQDLCGGATYAPFTTFPRPASLSSSSSGHHGGSGSGSSGMPPSPSGGSNSNVPSGGSNSGMPSGGSNSNMPSGGSNSDVPSGGSNSDVPSGGSNSEQPSGGPSESAV